MSHNFKNFPELTDKQMETLYWESPHKQITQNFFAKIDRVIDGDTVQLSTDFRDFTFPMRFLGINAPEMSEGGQESKSWLEKQVGNEDVEILINTKNRVDKFGRLLGEIFFMGQSINNASMRAGMSTTFANRMEGKIPNVNQELNIKKWF